MLDRQRRRDVKARTNKNVAAAALPDISGRYSVFS